MDPRGRLSRTPRRIGLALLVLVALPLVVLIGLSAEALVRRAATGESAQRERADVMLDEVAAALNAATDAGLEGLVVSPTSAQDQRVVEVAPGGAALGQPRTGYRRVPGAPPSPLPASFSIAIGEVLRAEPAKQLAQWTALAEREEHPRHRAIIRFRRAVCLLRTRPAESLRGAQADFESLLEGPEVWDEAGMPLALYVHLYLAEALATGGEPYEAARVLLNLERHLALDAWQLDPAVLAWHRRDVGQRLEDLVVRILEPEQREAVRVRRTETVRVGARAAWGLEALTLGLVSGPGWRGERLANGWWLYHRLADGGRRLLVRVSAETLGQWAGPVLEREMPARQARLVLALHPDAAPSEEAFRSGDPGGLLAGAALGVTPWGLEATRETARRRAVLHAVLLGLALVVILGGLLTGYRFLCREVEAARSKEAFLASVSHELRTPLTSIRIFAESLADGGVPGEKIQEYAGQIDREARRLTRLIEGVLDLAALESGQIGLAPVALSVASVLAETVQLFGHRGAEESCDLIVDTVPADLAVRADADALVQVLRIGLDNAVKYGPAGGQVVLGAHRTSADEVVLTVDDAGPGVPVDERGRVAQRFYRGRHAGGTPGIGLGLAIATTLTQAMGGRLELGESPLGGARLRVLLAAGDGAALQLASPGGGPGTP